MKKWIISYLVGYIVSATLIAGFLNSEDKYGHFSKYYKGRVDLGNDILIGFLMSGVWPISLPVMYLTTGFDEPGWSLKWK